MTCGDVERLLEAYLDGELDAARATDVEAHVETCATCAARLQAMRDLSATVRTAPYFRAPDKLAQWALPSRATAPSRWRWVPWAVAAAAVLATSTLFVVRRPVAQPSASIASMVLADHVRSLMADHLVDVASSDRHTVKPWFAGRLDYAPTVIDLAADGFPLSGGRLDYLDGRAVAALVYHRREHAINVFEWPDASGDAPLTAADDRGYRLLHWTSRGMTYWVVSDLARPELEDFVTKLAAALAAAS